MKVGVVGSGFVGSTAAYAMVMRGVGREIVLVDKNTKRAIAEAADIAHAIPFASAMKIRSGDYADLKGCRVVVLTAGVNQRPGETRMQLLERNASVFREIVPEILKSAPDAVLLVATNPVDVMTHFTAKLAEKHGIPRGRVIGSGTTLDTARFRWLLGARIGVDAHHVHAYVVGEHGDSEVLTWEGARVGGLALDELCRHRGVPLIQADREEIDLGVRRAAYAIIEGKSATYYGIGSAISRITEVILHDQRSILTVCTPEDELYGVRDVTASLPRLVGGQGILEQIPISLSEDERTRLVASAKLIRSAIDELPQV